MSQPAGEFHSGALPVTSVCRFCGKPAHQTPCDEFNRRFGPRSLAPPGMHYGLVVGEKLLHLVPEAAVVGAKAVGAGREVEATCGVKVKFFERVASAPDAARRCQTCLLKIAEAEAEWDKENEEDEEDDEEEEE